MQSVLGIAQHQQSYSSYELAQKVGTAMFSLYMYVLLFSFHLLWISHAAGQFPRIALHKTLI